MWLLIDESEVVDTMTIDAARAPRDRFWLSSYYVLGLSLAVFFSVLFAGCLSTADTPAGDTMQTAWITLGVLSAALVAIP